MLTRDQLRNAIALELSNAIADQLAHKAQTTAILKDRTDRILALVDSLHPGRDMPAIEADKRTR